MSEYVSLSTLIENPITQIKNELRGMNRFEEIDEGENIYLGNRPWAQVIPGPDRITLEGNQQLMHRFNVYVNFLRGGDATLPDLRNVAELAYNKLMEDQTHNNTCWHALPIRWHPGYFSLPGYRFAGVQTIWEVMNYQTFPLTFTDLGTPYTNMVNLVEDLIAELKDEILDIGEIDDINEGETLFEGEGTVAWVIPSVDEIAPDRRARLRHNMTVYQNILSSVPTMTFAEMRGIAQDVYDRLMEDITHNQKCLSFLPSLWHPGFVQYAAQSYVGVQSVWNASMVQTYTPT